MRALRAYSPSSPPSLHLQDTHGKFHIVNIIKLCIKFLHPRLMLLDKVLHAGEISGPIRPLGMELAANAIVEYFSYDQPAGTEYTELQACIGNFKKSMPRLRTSHHQHVPATTSTSILHIDNHSSNCYAEDSAYACGFFGHTASQLFFGRTGDLRATSMAQGTQNYTARPRVVGLCRTRVAKYPSLNSCSGVVSLARFRAC